MSLLLLVHIHCTVELVQLEKHGFWDADEQRKTLRAAVVDSIECLEAVMHRAKAEMAGNSKRRQRP